MISINQNHIQRLAPNAIMAYKMAFTKADQVLAKYGINKTALRVAHFMAQLLHEAGGLTVTEESLNYKPDALVTLFGPKRGATREFADANCRTAGRRANEEAIANTIYGGAWGAKNLGNTEPGDGYRFRGRGMTQLTGRANYRRIGQRLGVDLEANPELVTDPRYALEIPCIFWSDAGCSELADSDSWTGTEEMSNPALRRVTKAINGGFIGLAERASWLKKTKAVWR